MLQPLDTSDNNQLRTSFTLSLMNSILLKKIKQLESGSSTRQLQPVDLRLSIVNPEMDD